MINKVLCFGEVLWDAFADGKKAGGAPMNVALHLAQQGIPTQMASRIGTDNSGDELLEIIKAAGLDISLIQRDDELPTCEVTVQLDEHHHATYIIPKPTAWDNIRATSDLIAAAQSATAIVFGSVASRDDITRDALYTLLFESNALPIFDVNLRAPHYDLSTVQAMAARARVIKMNEEEAELLLPTNNSGDMRQRITEFQHANHHHTIIITRGVHGALVWHEEEFYEHPGQQVTVADTVGAGDSFLATFIAGLLKKQPIPEVLDRACRVGAYVASQRGANPKYPEGLI